MRLCTKCQGKGHSGSECNVNPNEAWTSVCYKCGGKNHKARNCPSIKFDVCYHCGYLGHHRLDCPFDKERSTPTSVNPLISPADVIGYPRPAPINFTGNAPSVPLPPVPPLHPLLPATWIQQPPRQAPREIIFIPRSELERREGKRLEESVDS
ncbi:hypothetical protein BLNAU_2246 [Blattamonas nauphoetae]|uniref:CCHC-type domain-containing protein n=1 Tax=Blattamonas nauphoetae TaxID=2049346 RepID=A0ABQ9YGN3_9EUKA|nr:hypothetical protein BLNAU_2246 [Blattamonas nauphoetae]